MPTLNRIRQVVTPKRVALLTIAAVVLALVIGAMRSEPTELGDTRALEVVVDVLSSDAPRVRDGMPVVREGWESEVPVMGYVRLVEPAARTRVSALGVEEQRVYVIVDVEEPPPSIGDGFRVDARIEAWRSDSALTVPASALVRAGREWAVFTIASGRAVQRTIEVGRNHSDTEYCDWGSSPSALNTAEIRPIG